MSADAYRFEPPIEGLTNAELLATLDVLLLEVERRLFRYSQTGHEILEMADEGLVLATRLAARLGQAQSAASHTQGHLQVIGVGSWQPSSTNPAWNADPRVTEGFDEPH